MMNECYITQSNEIQYRLIKFFHAKTVVLTVQYKVHEINKFHPSKNKLQGTPKYLAIITKSNIVVIKFCDQNKILMLYSLGQENLTEVVQDLFQTRQQTMQLLKKCTH
eukprot:TRINITY_DN2686_c0_g1_i3.p5 TRINITY_DN2686_c0_g1~~TRINITY_DN2686_c0_g1_i3.p5  ORF type:complete len:108 (-),score=1.65 TRINITY_DN2686_c0_g1_i3:594-917(-)